MGEGGRGELTPLIAAQFGSVFFLFFGLAVGGGFWIDVGLLLCVGLSAALLFCQKNRLTIRIFDLVSNGGALWLLPLGVYLILDAFGFLFSGEISLLWEKYRVTALLLFVLGTLMLSGAKQAFDAVFLGAAAAAVVTSVLTLLRYFMGGTQPLLYLLRFSLRRDYNMYATTLFVGWICFAFWMLGEKKRGWAIGGSLLILPVLLLSGSRRVLIAMPVALFCIVLAVLFPTGSPGILFRRAAALLLAVGLVLGQTAIWERSLASLSRDPRSAVRLQPGEGVTGQTAAAERYETIAQSSLFTKRRVIWGIACNELSGYSAVEWLVGRGGGENIRLYDRDVEALDLVYPDREARQGNLSAHNMLLADLLDGGILKAAALFWLLTSCGWGCLRLLQRDWKRGLAVGMILGFTILSNLVSNRYGLLYDRCFLLFYPLLLEMDTERKKLDESSDCNADHPASS